MVETVRDFFWAKINADGDCSHEIKRRLAPWKKSYDQPRQHAKKHSCNFADNDPYSQSYGFCSSRVQISELDHKESLELKN